MAPALLVGAACDVPCPAPTAMPVSRCSQGVRDTQTAPWPDMEIPMTPPPAGAAGAAALLDWRLQLAGRHMSDDLTGSLHGSEGGMSAALDTPVRASHGLH